MRYLPRARDDVLAAVEFYEAEAPGLGADFLAMLRHAIDVVSSTPEIGSRYAAGTRRIILQRFPFSLIYEITPDQLLVVAVAHHRRRPDYWQQRCS